MCRGAGKTISEKDKCKECRGKKVVKERKILEVHIEKGMKHNQKLEFHGDADEAPGTIPGDVIFVIQEKPHEVFKRKGNDLLIEKTLSLTEALCGYTFTITHLDGRILKVDSKRGDITRHEQVKMIPGEGMPLYGSGGYQKGKLFIMFKVEFPKDGTFSEAQIKALEAVLPPRPSLRLTGEEEEVNLQPVDPSTYGRDEHNMDADDDDDGPRGAQRVQCNNM